MPGTLQKICFYSTGRRVEGYKNLAPRLHLALLFCVSFINISFICPFSEGTLPLYFGKDVVIGCDWFILLSFVPVAIYPNADIQKSIIYEENKRKCGIYRWTNLVTGQSYIGSGTNLTRRFANYYSLAYLKREVNRGKSIIYNALLKHGYSNFKLEILEYCDPKDVIAREQYYIGLLKPQYNILQTAGSRFGQNHTEEARQAISKALKGRIFFKETIEKMRANALKRKHSEETKAKMGSSSRTAVAVEVTDLETGATNIYPSIKKAADALGCSNVALLYALKRETGNPYKGRYVIKKKKT
jgi:group I intron endonuclease